MSQDAVVVLFVIKKTAPTGPLWRSLKLAPPGNLAFGECPSNPKQCSGSMHSVSANADLAFPSNHRPLHCAAQACGASERSDSSYCATCTAYRHRFLPLLTLPCRTLRWEPRTRMRVRVRASAPKSVRFPATIDSFALAEKDDAGRTLCCTCTAPACGPWQLT